MANLDFTALRQEQKSGRESHTLTVDGVAYPIPSTPPFGFLLESQKLAKLDPDAEMDPQQINDLLVLGLGEEAVAAMIRDGMEIDDLEVVLTKVAALWNPEGEAQPQETTTS